MHFAVNTKNLLFVEIPLEQDQRGSVSRDSETTAYEGIDKYLFPAIMYLNACRKLKLKKSCKVALKFCITETKNVLGLSLVIETHYAVT